MSLNPVTGDTLSLIVFLSVHLLLFIFSFTVIVLTLCDALMFFYTCHLELLAPKHRATEFLGWRKEDPLVNKQLRFCLCRRVLGERRSKMLDGLFYTLLILVAGREHSPRTATQHNQCCAPTSSPFSCNSGKLPSLKSLEVEVVPKFSTLAFFEE